MNSSSSPHVSTIPRVSTNSLGGVLDEQLVAEVRGARAAVLCTDDGLLRAHSSTVPRDVADKISAAVSARVTIGRAFGPLLTVAGNPGKTGQPAWRQGLEEFNDGWVITRQAGENTLLAMTTDGDTDLYLVGVVMEQVINHLKPILDTPPRDQTAAAPGTSASSPSVHGQE